ncbi:MAG: ParB/RepB/Spo0J family partition protein [Candidatus Cloacimonetes bacterium]|nr:ParB/RepB/Spo0J family partition protein [Candidatus Cloacimonadota bacterium]
MSTKRGLGRGLGALLKTPEPEVPAGAQVLQIALDQIVPNPYQPRKKFSSDSIQELASSIEKNDLLQPILLRKSKDQYQIVSGERRFRAFVFLDRQAIPAILSEIDDQQMLVNALLENIQREDLNPLDEAKSYHQLAELFTYTHEELAKTLGKSRSHISNSMRLLRLPQEVMHYLESGILSTGGARALLGLKSKEDIILATSHVIVNGYNVRQIEQYVKAYYVSSEVSPSNPNHKFSIEQSDKYTQLFETNLDYKCKFKSNGKSLKLEIEFDDESQVDNFLQFVKKQ